MTQLAYLAHPVGNGPNRVVNLLNTNKWFLWLYTNTDFALVVPWKIYVDNLSEDHLTRAMRDDLAVLGRCDVLILTGGRISPGMQTELSTARLQGLRIVDLTSCGYDPDLMTLDQITIATHALALAA